MKSFYIFHKTIPFHFLKIVVSTQIATSLEYQIKQQYQKKFISK